MRGNDLEVSLQQAKHESQSQLDAQCHLWICDMKYIEERCPRRAPIFANRVFTCFLEYVYDINTGIEN